MGGAGDVVGGWAAFFGVSEAGVSHGPDLGGSAVVDLDSQAGSWVCERVGRGDGSELAFTAIGCGDGMGRGWAEMVAGFGFNGSLAGSFEDLASSCRGCLAVWWRRVRL